MQEDTLQHYLRYERHSDATMLQNTDSPGRFINQIILSVISISIALITIVAWTGRLLQLKLAVPLVVVTSIYAIRNIVLVAKGVKQLHQNLEHQMFRKYEYWMPDSVDLPENHPRARTDTT